MANEVMIPLLPCRAINDMLGFYQALGFAVTYQQTKPNNYAVVQREGIELHFFTMPQYKPADSYSTCYIRTPDVDGLYKAFQTGLRQAYGRVPSAGIPRVIPLKNKSHNLREFIVVDPGGNWIRIGQVVEQPLEQDPVPTTKLGKALHAAQLLNRVGHYANAASKIDPALASETAAPVLERIPALVFRALLAINMDDSQLARELLASVAEIPLQDAEREALEAELAQAEDLASSLAPVE